MNTYALTTATHQRRALFVRLANAELLVSTLFHYREKGRYRLHAFVVMPDHMHVLLTPEPSQTIERCAQCIKGGFSFAIRGQFKGEIWQTGFHEHRVRDFEDFDRQYRYIERNPQNRGLSDYPFVHSRYLERMDPIPAHLQPVQV